MTETDPLAKARAIMQQQAADAGQPVTERWHNHASNGTCGPSCPAPGIGWDGQGVVTDHFEAEG
jgi:hypothetical protein